MVSWKTEGGVVEGVVALHDSRSSQERNIEDAGSVVFTRDAILTDAGFRSLEPVDTRTNVQRV